MLGNANIIVLSHGVKWPPLSGQSATYQQAPLHRLFRVCGRKVQIKVKDNENLFLWQAVREMKAKAVIHV